jgi:hypothetical protein
MNKLWHQMTAVEAMQAKVDYAVYNYGDRHPITKACRAGDVTAFMAATKSVTESSDAVLAGIQNKVICGRAA